MNTSKLFYKKLDENYQNEEIVEDPEKNPELDSYNFMKIILECLRLLEQLPEALETIRQRLPLELYSVVEKTINEIDKKNENSYNISKNSKHIFKSKNISDLIGINSQEAKSNLLKDMLKLLYSKLDSIVQIHAFILNTSEKMLKLEGIQSTTYTIRDVWIAVQNEIRSLLYDYLTSPETGTNTYQNLFYSINERLKDSKKNRERNKLLFRFIDEDFTKSTNELFKKNNIYDNVLKDVIKRKEHNHTQSLIVIDKYSNSHKVIGHKLLLPPDSRRVLAIFKPTCDFMEKMENIVSISKGQDDISDFRVFLDDFICNIFLPQMEEKVMEYFHLYISGEDEFQAELNESLYPWPLLKSSVACVIITKGLCSTINDVPIHQEKFIYMIEEIINKYYEKCVLRFKALLSCDQSITNNDQTICSKWIKEEEIIQLLSQNSNLLNRSDLINKDLDGKLAKEELNIELGLKEDRSFERGELIFDYNKLEALANLNHSLEWLVLQIKRLLSQNIKINKTTLDEKIMSSSSSLEINDLMNTNSNESLAMHQPKSDKPISLEISEEMQNRIVSILNNFQNLSEMCLYALRIELRCHAMFYLDLSFREGNFLLDNEIPEPDSYVFMLNKDLIKCEEIMKSILKPNKNRFLFNDLGSLMVNILMTNVKYIKCINKNGILRLGRNVRSIQQVLNSISGSYESSMDIAKEYFELLDLDSEEFMKKIEDNGQGPFTYEQLKFLLDLMNSEYLNKDLILQKLEKEKQIQLARSLTNINVDDDFASLQNEKRNIDEIQNKYYEYVEKLKMLCSDSY
jgi:exocyst complex component 4